MTARRKTVETPRSEAQLYIAKAKQFSAEATAAMKRFTQRCSHVECRSCRD